MLRATTSRVSFTTSHTALMVRSSKPLLGSDVHSHMRAKGAWDEMPFCSWFMSRSEWWAWDWKCRYELGIRDLYKTQKWTYMLLYCMPVFMAINFYGLVFPPLYHVVYGEIVPWMNRDNGVEYSKRVYGFDVWCADGKFVQPFWHINPPMFTMKQEDL